MQVSSKQFLLSEGCHGVITLFPVDVSRKSICYRAYANRNFGYEVGALQVLLEKNFAFLSSLELLRYKIISDFLQGKSVTTLKTYSSLLKEGNLSIYSSLQRRILNLKRVTPSL